MPEGPNILQLMAGPSGARGFKRTGLLIVTAGRESCTLTAAPVSTGSQKGDRCGSLLLTHVGTKEGATLSIGAGYQADRNMQIC